MLYAIIGMGMIYKFISQAIESLPAHQIVAVCDTDSSKKQDTHYSFFTDYNEMCISVFFDYAIVLVPNNKKDNVIKDILQKGHRYRLIVEKPVATSFSSFAELEPFLKHGQITTIYHRTYNFKYNLFKNFVRHQKEKISEIEITYYENILEHTTQQNILCIPDKDGGGCIWDNLPNCLDLLLSVFPEVIFTGCTLLKKNDYGASIFANLHYLCENISCTVTLSWKYPGERKMLRVITKDGANMDFDMVEGHTPPKKSLISEYKNFYSNLENGLEHDNYERTQRNMKLIFEALTD